MTNSKVEVLEERMKNLIKSNDEAHSEILRQIECMNKKLDEAFVTKEEFIPVKTIVYGLVGIILTAFAYALVELIKNQPLL